MIGRWLVWASVSVAVAGCATSRASLPLPTDAGLRLETVDGVPAKGAAFRLRFTTESNYIAAYDCGEQSGAYRYGARLVLRPSAWTGQTCDRTDIATGQTITFDRRLVDHFFADPEFSVRSSDGGVVLTNSRHSFAFARDR